MRTFNFINFIFILTQLIDVREVLQTRYDKDLKFWNNFLKTEDKQKIFDIKLPKSDYNNKTYRKRMSNFYPMILHTTNHNWSLDERLAKDVFNYIKIVDEYNKQNNIFLQAQKKKSA